MTRPLRQRNSMGQHSSIGQPNSMGQRSSIGQPEPGPIDDAELDRAADLLRGRNLAVLTGAGVSTDSGIPDYRGDGAPRRNPMLFSEFLASEAARRRYWAGSHLGWRRFQSVEPNDGHAAIAELEAAGIANGVVTQNVDDLHLRAGSARVIDLHGSMHRVVCLDCGQYFAREAVGDALEAANAWLDAPETVELGPDGDVIPERLDTFVIPSCTVCGGTLKPDVVFFGEFVPTNRFEEARALVTAADALLIAGSSLVVNTGIRLLEASVRHGSPVVIINRGETKGDSRAAIKIDAGTSPALRGLLDRLTA